MPYQFYRKVGLSLGTREFNRKGGLPPVDLCQWFIRGVRCHHDDEVDGCSCPVTDDTSPEDPEPLAPCSGTSPDSAVRG